MLQKIYQTLIRPRATSPDAYNRELVLNFLLLGVITLGIASFINTLFSLVVLQAHNFWGRAILVAVAVCFFSGLYTFSRIKRQQNLASLILVFMFFGVACLLAYQWGVLIPTSSLLFGLVIVMAGILLGSRSALYTAAIVSIAVGLLAYAQTHAYIQPDTSWNPGGANFGDIVGFYSIFAVIAFICWLFNRQMEHSLVRAQQSEAALSRQKALLEIKVEERTRELEAAQLEKVQQVYRFAELGRVSSALFHDLANHLTNVSLEIEGLEPQGRSKIMRRIQRDISYIDDVVQRVRFQLRGQSEIEQFNTTKEVDQVIKILSYRAVQSKIVIEVKHGSAKPIFYTGDITRFRQLINNLLTNAIEAYPMPTTPTKKARKIAIRLEQTSSAVIIHVKDWGVGIKRARQSKVFEPFYSDKADGTGIGLFIVKQIVEQDLGGSIMLTSSPRQGTEFVVTLPIKT